MIYLLLSILTSSMVGIVMRFAQGRIRAKTCMLAMNYLTCTTIAASNLHFQHLIPSGELAGRSVALGVLNGFFFVSALMLSQYNIRKNGVVLASVFSRIGQLMVPLVLSVILFSEFPRPVQLVGAALALVAIVAMNYTKERAAASAMLYLMYLFVADGFASSMSKVFRELGNPEFSSQFLFYTFGVAFLLCLIFIIKDHEHPGILEAVFGIMIGIPNFFGTNFTLKALESVPAVVVYPVRSVGSILFTAIIGVVFFHERLTKRQWYAVAVILGSIVLLNM